MKTIDKKHLYLITFGKIAKKSEKMVFIEIYSW